MASKARSDTGIRRVKDSFRYNLRVREKALESKRVRDQSFNSLKVEYADLLQSCNTGFYELYQTLSCIVGENDKTNFDLKFIDIQQKVNALLKNLDSYTNGLDVHLYNTNELCEICDDFISRHDFIMDFQKTQKSISHIPNLLLQLPGKKRKEMLRKFTEDLMNAITFCKTETSNGK